MPKYCYRCDQCEHEFEAVHSMTEKLTLCIACGSDNKLKRIPQIQMVRHKTNAGAIVKEAIEENARILKEERKKRVEMEEK